MLHGGEVCFCLYGEHHISMSLLFICWLSLVFLLAPSTVALSLPSGKEQDLGPCVSKSP